MRIVQTIEKSGLCAGKTPPKPGGLGPHIPISPLEPPPTVEETLIQLDCLLSWCCLVLKQLAEQQKNAGRMELAKPNLWPGKIGYQILQSVVSQAANSSGPEVPQPKIIGFWSSPVETSEEGIRANAHP
ncbi:hypothetical protein DSO57_1004956, partial [Entomophthora muscae]